MDKLENLALLSQMIESAEKNLQSAKQLLREVMGGAPMRTISPEAFASKAAQLSVAGGGKIIEGVFDGQNMVGPDGKQYPVPANYASKSKLVEGDVLKLTIAEDGSFIYKQIGPIERKKMLGMLVQDERGDFRVLAEGRPYRVLLASLTYFKAEPGDEVTIIVPEGKETEVVWAAVENVIKKGQGGAASADMELIAEGDEAVSKSDAVLPEEEEL
jgi:hypothetical protein